MSNLYKVNTQFHKLEYEGSFFDTATWLNGTSFKLNLLKKSGIPIIKIRELKDGITLNTEFYELDGKEKYLLKKGDLLYTWSGNPDTSLDAFYFDLKEGLLNQHIFKIEPKSFINTNYFYYLLKYLKPRLRAIARDKQTTGLGHITLKDLKELQVQIPTNDLQNKIVEILKPLDDKIELIQKMNENLEDIAKAIFKSWFIDFDPVKAKAEGRPTGLSQEISDLFPDSFEDSELGEIPKGWKVSKLGNHINLVKGKSYKSSELEQSKTALITLKSFQRNGGYREDGLKEYVGSYKPEQVVTEEDLVVALTDVTQAADVIGKPALIIGNEKYDCLVISLDVGVIRVLQESFLSKSFIYNLMLSNRYVNNSLGYTNGTNVLHLQKEAITDFKFPLSNQRFLELYDQISSNIIKKINRNSKSNGVLINIRDTLLPKLISGELRIKDAEKYIEEAGI